MFSPALAILVLPAVLAAGEVRLEPPSTAAAQALELLINYPPTGTAQSGKEQAPEEKAGWGNWLAVGILGAAGVGLGVAALAVDGSGGRISLGLGSGVALIAALAITLTLVTEKEAEDPFAPRGPKAPPLPVQPSLPPSPNRQGPPPQLPPGETLPR